ncbi:inositol 2-dehydrogenase (plasmid) [Entomospira entomophila]|uniref:Inositol 2-dehydrogenase n=1 Tax=Entomospira entomophila TaxID=2719988 RepID=A0A968GCW7_9SPIO|nr:inositol 2-dehydrogenase [Entomospira entomophilus]NIZ41288.1 inositol 2-dehydrogenase [Entomospira entomophilus]WDI36186.1 inositol 2-dehydrogenase [Entomospira entomophilus]
MNVGIIGVGRIGKVHAESISKYVKGVTIKSIYNLIWDDATVAWANEMGLTERYDDYQKILQDPSIDAVLICTSTDTHAKISLEAIAANKHVFCEKPVDHHIEQIIAVQQALEGKKLKYQVGFNRRFDANYRAIREAVAENKVGKVHLVTVTSRDPAPPAIDYIKVSGGLFLDMAIHDFDMVRYLTGEEVVEVYAAGNVLVDSAIGEAGDIDTAIVTLKLASGAIAVIDNSRKSVYGYDQRAEVFGSGGSVAISNNTKSSAVYSGEAGVIAEKPLHFFLERYMQAYAAEIREFLHAVQHDTPTPVTIVDGLNAVVIAKAAKLSYDENRPVTLKEILS